MSKSSLKQFCSHNPPQPPKLHTLPTTYYIWCGGSCDYGREERCSAGAYIIQKGDTEIERYVTTDDHTTEFRMILTAMIHAMETLPGNSDIVFLTNVSYIAQNFDKQPTDVSANADLINRCITAKARHSSATVRIVPFHKYPQLPETHDMAREAMVKHRSRLRQTL